jgi:hypothetical protein
MLATTEPKTWEQKQLIGTIRCRLAVLYLAGLMMVSSCGGGGEASSSSPPPSGALSLSGQITYDFVLALYDENAKNGTLGFSQITVKPVRGASVKVLQGTKVLAATETDGSGNYILQYTPSGNAALQLVAYAESSNPPIRVADNTDSNSLWGLVGGLDGISKTKNLHAATGWNGSSYVDANRAAAPFAILDSMYTAAKAFASVRNVAYPTLTAYWSPQNVPEEGSSSNGQIGTSHFNPSENAIYILGKDKVDTDEFDTHVIVHEWAHYFQSNLSRSDSPGGSHGSGYVADPRLSFSEGSASAIAAMVLNDPLYVDTLWLDGITLTAFGANAETTPTPTDDPNPGVLSESSITRLLYDAFDSGSNESFDQLAVGLGTIFDIFAAPLKTTDAMVTVGPFISGLKQQSGVSAAAVDALLSHWIIGPITTQWGDGDSTLREMYTDVTSFPQTKKIALVGGSAPNSWDQNQYYVFNGNGFSVTVSTAASQDVDIEIYQAGKKLGSATGVTGNETLQVATQSGKKYVVVLTGYGSVRGNYDVTLNFTSP